MPVIRSSELGYYPHHLVWEGVKFLIGWEYRAGKKGGPCFLVARWNAVGTIKTIQTYAMTEDGWSQAWRALAGQNAESAAKALAELEARAARARAAEAWPALSAGSLGYVPNAIFLGGYARGTELAAGKPYDVRFLDDRIAVFQCKDVDALLEVAFADVEAVEISGPGLVKSGGGLIGGGFGLAGAAEGMAIAALLNALTTKVTVKTVVRIEGTNCELFFLHSVIEPEALRIELSRGLGAIREARANLTQAKGQDSAGQRSLVDELAKLASMLDQGLLTRD